MRRVNMAAAALCWAVAASSGSGQNVLNNPSFEQAGSVVTGWTAFGNVFREPVAAVQGTRSVKLFGNFTGEANFSGLFQDVPASAGQEWTVGVTGFNAAFDALQGGNRALLKVEFLDSGGGVVSSAEAEVLTAATPVGTFVPASVTTAAPIGTVTARVTLLFSQQADNAGGSAFFDVVTASVLGQGSVPLANPSFEEGDGPIAQWANFNNAFRTTNAPRTGAANLTLASGPAVSGVSQGFAALPGSVWEASVWARNDTANAPLTLPDFVLMNIEWLDSAGSLISFETSLVADGFTATDVYQQTVLMGTAPEGTATAKFVLLYNTSGGTGSLQLDDASFVRVSTPPPPPPTNNLLNNPGFELALGFNFANPLNWNGFFGGPPGTFLQAFNNTGATPRNGNNALVTTIRGSETNPGFNAFTGHVQEVPGVVAGQRYDLTVYARANPVVLDGAEFRVEWVDASNVEVGRFNMPIESMLTGEYQAFTITDTAPAGATKAKIVMAVQSFTHTGAFADTSVAWDDVSFGVRSCAQDYNGIEGVNGDDLADYIADFFDSIGVQAGFGVPIAVPGGFSGNATAAFNGFGRPCASAPDVPQPNPWGAPVGAYREAGFKCSVGINNDACSSPNGDDLADYISIFFNGCP